VSVALITGVSPSTNPVNPAMYETPETVYSAITPEVVTSMSLKSLYPLGNKFPLPMTVVSAVSNQVNQLPAPVKSVSNLNFASPVRLKSAVTTAFVIPETFTSTDDVSKI
jgi:hypothetical protein